MCYRCWEEYGKPKIINQRVLRAAAMVDKVNPFGRFHIVVEDFNIEDDNVDFCLGEPIPDHEDPIDREFGALFRLLSENERATALAIDSGFISSEGVENPDWT